MSGFVQAVLDICRCGHAKLQHSHQGGGDCINCLCSPFHLDAHRYPIGLMASGE